MLARAVLGWVPGPVAGVLAAVLLAEVPAAVAAALTVWAAATLPTLLEIAPTRADRVRSSVTRGLGTCCAVAVVAVLVGASTGTARDLMAVLAAATVALAASTALTAPRRGEKRVVLVGERADVDALAERLERAAGTRVVGACVPRTGSTIPIQSPLRVPTSSQLAAVPGLAERLEAHCVVAVPGATLTSDDVRRLAWSLDRSPVSLHLAWGFDWAAAHRVRVRPLGNGSVLDLGRCRPSAGVRACKWLVDRVGGLALLVGAAPLLAAMWVAVRLETPGGGFFRQTRVGLDGKPFTMLKMRTMCQDAEARKESLQDLNDVDQTLFKIRTDPRVTKVGALLRKTSLDELPQLVNVVRGEMSLIGPRPALPGEVAQYAEEARRRMVVRPGMTGLWQVSGRSDLSWEESIRLDLHYADNWRLLDDLMIAARTVTAVARARGAY